MVSGEGFIIDASFADSLLPELRAHTWRSQPRGLRDPSAMRRWNEYAVFSALKNLPPKRISELADITGLTVATLDVVVKELEEKGWLTGETEPSRGKGRPARTYRFNRPEGIVVGIDVGAHFVRAAVLDFTPTVLSTYQIAVAEMHGDRDGAVERIFEQITNEQTQEIWACGLAVSGLVEETGLLVESPSVPVWNNTYPLNRYRHLLGPGALIVNDVCAAIHAGRQGGIAMGYNDLLWLQTGRRPTLSIMHNGKLRHGAHGFAGDITADPRVPTEDRPESLANFGGQPNAIGRIISRAQSGDPAAEKDVVRLMDALTPALISAVAIDDPQLLVIAGALAPFAHLFQDRLETALVNHIRRSPRIIVSPADAHASAHGAALLAHDRVWATLASSRGVSPLSHDVFAFASHGSDRAVV